MDDRTESERFEAFLIKRAKANKRTYENHAFLQNASGRYVNPGIQFGFVCWLASKEDAKPVVEIHYNKYTDSTEAYGVCVHAGGPYAYRTSSKEDASWWALTNGYRLE